MVKNPATKFVYRGRLWQGADMVALGVASFGHMNGVHRQNVALGEFVYRRRVQYNETDASGIVHFSAFFVFAEEAEHAMWRALGLSVEPRDTEIGWPRISASFDFLRALRFEDEIEVRLRVIGKTAKTLRYQAVIVHDGRYSAAGTMSTICVAKRLGQPLRAIAIPQGIAEKFTVVEPLEIAARPAAAGGAGKLDPLTPDP